MKVEGDDAAIIAAVTAILSVIQAVNAKYRFLYTLERDEVLETVAVLSGGLSEEGRRALEPAVEEALAD